MKYIALENLNFIWDCKIVDNVVDMWNKGSSLKEIVNKTKRREEEVFLLLLDLSMNKKIKKRKNGIWGGHINE